MLNLLLILGLAVVLCFGLVVFFGAPYLPTLKAQVTAGLDLADLQAGDTLLELGCGDGRVVLAAARRGWCVVGYELNPLLVMVCRLRTWRYRKQVRIVWGNFLTQPWPPAEAIFVFGLKTVMQKLDKKIMQSDHKPVKLISFAFEIPGKQARRRKNGLFLYKYD